MRRRDRSRGRTFPAWLRLAYDDNGICQEHIRLRYVAPARKQGVAISTVVAGDVHSELGLRGRVRLVCQALESRRLLEQNGLCWKAKRGRRRDSARRFVSPTGWLGAVRPKRHCIRSRESGESERTCIASWAEGKRFYGQSVGRLTAHGRRISDEHRLPGHTMLFVYRIEEHPVYSP